MKEGGIRGLWAGWVPNVQRAALVNLGGILIKILLITLVTKLIYYYTVIVSIIQGLVFFWLLLLSFRPHNIWQCEAFSTKEYLNRGQLSLSWIGKVWYFALRLQKYYIKLYKCLTEIFSSTCSGLVAAIMGTPADVVKTRIMNQPRDSKGRSVC